MFRLRLLMSLLKVVLQWVITSAPSILNVRVLTAVFCVQDPRPSRYLFINKLMRGTTSISSWRLMVFAMSLRSVISIMLGLQLCWLYPPLFPPEFEPILLLGVPLGVIRWIW